MTQKNDCSNGSCTVTTNGDGKSKLVKASDLPLHGNPYPPKDIIQDDTPSSLELTVRSVRTTVQPFMAPFCSAYQKTSDILSIGAAHTRTTIANLQENRGRLKNGLIISGFGLFGLVLARRKGIFKKFLYSSLFMSGAALACYPREVREKTELAFFIAKNRLPPLVQQQYHKITGWKSSTTNQESLNDSEVVTNQSKESKN